MVRLSNWAVFSWNFLLHRIFSSWVFTRRSKARETPTHLRSLSLWRNRNSKQKQKQKPYRQNQSTGESQHKLNPSRDFFWFLFFDCNPKEKTKDEKSQPFSQCIPLSLSHLRSLERDRDQRQINKSRKLFFFFDDVGDTREEKGR